MADGITKGQTVALGNETSLVYVGIKWDFGKDADGYTFGVNVDASAFICDANGKVKDESCFVFYNNYQWGDRVVWLGDDYMDGGEHDDDEIFVNQNELPDWVDQIVIVATIYDAVHRRQSFKNINGARVRVSKHNSEFDRIGETIAAFNLGDDFAEETALIIGEIRRAKNGWVFKAVGDGCQGDLETLCRRYGVLVN